jgi:hypothetical protein
MLPLDNALRKNRTVIRPFTNDDIGMLYLEYQAGEMNLPDNMLAEEFLYYVKQLHLAYDSRWVVEDAGHPIALICIKSNGWLIEPHVDTFKSASKAAIYRGFMKFFQEVNDRVGACLVRTLANTRHVFQRLERHKMLSYVGEIPDGDSLGTVYLYCNKGRD